MPDTSQHRDQSLRNKRVYRDRLDGPEAQYSEWAVTTLFYTALHDMDAYLYQLAGRVDPGNHRDRDSLVRTHCRRAWPTYKKLKDASEQGRYRCRRFTKAEIERYEEDALRKLPRLLR